LTVGVFFNDLTNFFRDPRRLASRRRLLARSGFASPRFHFCQPETNPRVWFPSHAFLSGCAWFDLCQCQRVSASRIAIGHCTSGHCASGQLSLTGFLDLGRWVPRPPSGQSGYAQRTRLRLERPEPYRWRVMEGVRIKGTHSSAVPSRGDRKPTTREQGRGVAGSRLCAAYG